MEEKLNSLEKTARIIGLIYFIWILTGLYGMFYIPSQINMRGDAATTAQNILSQEFLFRTGIVMGLITNTIWVFLVLSFYRLFKSVNKQWARFLVAFVLVQIPISLIIATFNITTLMILKGGVLETFELIQRQDLAVLFLKISEYGVLALELFWGLWLFPLAMLVYSSCFLPRFLGVWLFINGFVYVLLSFTSIIIPQYKEFMFTFGMPAMFGELALVLWLLFKGAKKISSNG